jgi:hypothetical protein
MTSGCRRALALMPCLICLALPAGAQPATPVGGVFGAPVEEGGRVFSMGQPPRLKWNAAITFDTEGDRGLAVVGAQEDLFSPMVGVAAVRAEGVLGGGRQGLEGGGRLLLVSPMARLHSGIDYDVRQKRLDWLIGLEMNVRRGGVVGRGTRLRFDWLPGRNHTVELGLSVPFGQRAGSTRPPAAHDRLQVSDPPLPRRTGAASLAAPLAEFRAAAEAVTRVALPLRSRLGADAARAVAADIADVRALDTPARLSVRMMQAWQDVFARALSDDPPTPASLADLTTRARRIVLQDMLLPFDGLLGQHRKPSTLEVFARGAARRFATELAGETGLSPTQRTAAAAAFVHIAHELDEVRAGLRRLWQSDRRVFIPLQVALAPDEADTQAEIDALIEGLTGERFSEGNRIYYVLNEAFQYEFLRTVRRAERYHVLWIHDVRGRGETGPIDRVSAIHVREYFEALTARVRQYDDTGALPGYFIILDEFYYESNDGRLWMTMLERPLDATITLPAGYEAEQQALRQAQQALRAAVAASRQLQTRRARFGEAWLRALVKVHVNITHPSDFSFWAPGLLPVLGMPDNLMRDHRKIVFHDIGEDDPYRGEVIFSGMGLGEHYAGATWEDRALIVQGPAALDVKAAVRRLFERQRIPSAAIPGVFREQPLAPDYAARVAAEIERAAAAGTLPSARALQAHNDVGYGVKKASAVKALLLSTLPAGTVIVTPDSLWEDTMFGSLLMGSALRGCRVLVIAPALENAPGTAWPVIARTHMLFSRLLALSQGLEPRVTEAGGLFKVGMFHEQAGVGDLVARARAQLARVRASSGWFARLAPFTADAIAQWEQRTEELARRAPPDYLVPEPLRVRPKLHMKGLYAASPSAWDGLFVRPEMTPTLLEYLEQRARQVHGTVDEGRDLRALPEAVWRARRRLLAAHEATLTPDEAARAVLYLQIGSYNMNDRSMLLDGEVALTVSGTAALSGMFDFLAIAGMTDWIDRQDQLDALLPAPSGWQRLLARWARSIL